MGRLLQVLLPAALLTTTACAQEVRIAFGESLEPYVAQHGRAGLEVELVRAALAERGYQLASVLLSQPRLPQGFRGKNVDGIATVQQAPDDFSCLTDSYIEYQNVAITLKNHPLPLREVADLSRYSVLAFPQARSYLGPAFTRMADGNPHYSETAQQVNQNRLLNRLAVDVVVADRNIFAWMNRKLQQEFHEKPQPFQEYPLFPPTPYRMAFHNQELCRDFNQGLQAIRKDGRYQQILQRYR